MSVLFKVKEYQKIIIKSKFIANELFFFLIEIAQFQSRKFPNQQ
jgi:hypothetical protein